MQYEFKMLYINAKYNMIMETLRMSRCVRTESHINQ